jgi:hypothetical protein
MSEKTVKARKTYRCDFCESIINKGDFHKHGKTRGPRFDEFDDQIGIEYLEWRLCLDGEKCNKTYWGNIGNQTQPEHVEAK